MVILDSILLGGALGKFIGELKFILKQKQIKSFHRLTLLPLERTVVH